MASAIEVRGFMDLAAIFSERGWPRPLTVEIAKCLTGGELLAKLEVPEKQVEIIFINGKAFTPLDALINPGDRVALVPPGTPGPYRVLLGFK